MIRRMMTRLALSVPMLAIVGCAAAEAPSSVSVDTVEELAHLESIGPDVLDGEYDGQRVLFAGSEKGVDWLHARALDEHDSLLERYTRTGDERLLPRLTWTESILLATAENPSGPLVITSTLPVVEDEPETAFKMTGPSCSGGGSTCECASGCTCTSSDTGCRCSCPTQ